MEYMPLWITLKTRSETAEQYAVYKYRRQKTNLDKPFCKVIQGFQGLFVNNGLRVISYPSTLNVRVAGTKLDKSSMADFEV